MNAQQQSELTEAQAAALRCLCKRYLRRHSSDDGERNFKRNVQSAMEALSIDVGPFTVTKS